MAFVHGGCEASRFTALTELKIKEDEVHHVENGMLREREEGGVHVVECGGEKCYYCSMYGSLIFIAANAS